MNTRRMNRLEELGRVDAEKADTRKGKRNLREEKSRIVRELKADGGKVRGKQKTQSTPGPKGGRPKTPRDPKQQRRMGPDAGRGTGPRKRLPIKIIEVGKQDGIKLYSVEKKDGGKVKRKKMGPDAGDKKRGKFPDLTGDGKVTRADVLRGRGVFKSGGIAKRGRGCEIR